MENVKPIRPGGNPLEIVKWLNEVVGEVVDLYVVATFRANAQTETAIRGSAQGVNLPEGLSWASFCLGAAAHREMNYHVTANPPTPPGSPSA